MHLTYGRWCRSILCCIGTFPQLTKSTTKSVDGTSPFEFLIVGNSLSWYTNIIAANNEKFFKVDSSKVLPISSTLIWKSVSRNKPKDMKSSSSTSEIALIPLITLDSDKDSLYLLTVQIVPLSQEFHKKSLPAQTHTLNSKIMEKILLA